MTNEEYMISKNMPNSLYGRMVENVIKGVQKETKNMSNSLYGTMVEKIIRGVQKEE